MERDDGDKEGIPLQQGDSNNKEVNPEQNDDKEDEFKGVIE